MNLGKVRVGEVELPITVMQLREGRLLVTAERQAPDPGCLIMPAGAVDLFGADGEPVPFAPPYVVESVSAWHGGTLTVSAAFRLAVEPPTEPRYSFEYELR